MRSEEGKAERLFRAAVAAYCALPRPTRHDAVQLDALALPLYESVPVESRRYVAAALSECRRGPVALVRRLADEPIEISAPLLMKSTALGDIDLVALIARHGLAHARAIRARATLNPAIERLVDAIVAAAPPDAEAADVAPVAETPTETIFLEEEIAMSPTPEPVSHRPGNAAEETRSRLRGMMAVGGEAPAPVERPERPLPRDLYERLRETAFTGTPALFQTALADAADISFAQAIPLVLPTRRRQLMLVLRGLDLSVEQAFMVVSAIDPSAFHHSESVRIFHDTFSMLHGEAGRDEIRRLRVESVAAMVRRPGLAQQPDKAPATPERLLKAS